MLRQWLAEDGASVTEGDAVALVEAMKMETRVLATRSGRIRLRTALGAAVEAGEILARIDDGCSCQRLPADFAPMLRAFAAGHTVATADVSMVGGLITKGVRDHFLARDARAGVAVPLVRDGQLVLCDWAGAQLEAEAKAPYEETTSYQSAWRMNHDSWPLCKEDDLYALGVSIWEIWMGRIPFKFEEHEYLADEIADGLKPDLDAVDDENVRSLIEMYLNSKPSVLG